MITITFYDRETAQWAGDCECNEALLRMATIAAYCETYGYDAVIKRKATINVQG